MRKITLIFALMFIAVGQAQTFQWVKNPPITLTANASLTGYTTTLDPFGNVYFTGFKENTYAYGQIFGTQYYNKYDTDGNLIFSKTFTGRVNIYNAASDSDGNIIMAIGYVNTLAIDNLQLSTVNQGVNYIVAKFDPNGNLLWHDPMIIANSSVDQFRALVIDGSNNIYMGYDNYNHGYIKKLTPAGVPLLTIQQANVSMLTSLSVDTAGNIYAAGSCAESDSAFNGVLAPTNFEYNTYAAKYSATGVFQWVKYVEDITCPTPLIIAANPDEIYLSSSLEDNFSFGAITAEGPLQSSYSDIYITKLNGQGQFQWLREVPGGGGGAEMGNRNFLTADVAGNVYFAGNTRGNINWGNNVVTTVPGFDANALIVKISPAGTILMAKTAGGASWDWIDCIAVNPAGEMFISGMVNGNATFDGISNVTTVVGYYPFLAKISGGALGTGGLNREQPVLYPNPTSGSLYFANLSTNTSAEIINMLGQVVKNAVISTDTPVAVHDLPQGNYIIKPDGYRPIKFIKN